MPLTDKEVLNAKPGTKPYKLFDGEGMYLLVQPDGGKYWRLKYRFAGREKLLALGVYDTVSLAEARQRRAKAKAALADALDPSAERQSEKRNQRIAAENTLQAIAAEWHENNKHSWLSHPASGALEVLKLAALVAMVADHVNKYAFDGAYPMMEHMGRLSFPLFALVVAANLRWNTADPHRYFMRLAVWGMASQAIYTWVTGNTDLNVLLTLGIGVQLALAVEALRQHSSMVGVLWLMLVIVATLPCDYPLTGPLLVALFPGWFARPGPYTALLAILGVAALNTSLLFAPAALASLIVAAVVAWWRPRLPRLTRYWFYPFYPTHFAVIRWIA